MNGAALSGSARKVAVDDIADYITVRMAEAGAYLNVLKLHKLVYYVQAWHLAFFGRRCFDSAFEAWVHGPVSRELYARFRSTKNMYSPVTQQDVRAGFKAHRLPGDAKRHVDSILEAYAKFSDDQLEELTHRERPWQLARGALPPNARCQTEIADAVMKAYYGARLASQQTA